MSDFRQYFLEESISNLKDLQKTIAAPLTEEARREAFRKIHSIKGGAQTFDFAPAAQIAAEIENALAARENTLAPQLLAAGVKRLIDALRGGNAGATEPVFIAEKSAEERRSDILITRIAPQVFKNFSHAEQTAAMTAIRAGLNILCAEIGFQPANFADEYRRLRKSLGEKGEIIASLPSEKFKSSGEIGFQIFLASTSSAAELQKFLDDFPLEISSHTCEDGASASELYRMLKDIVAHGEKIAAGARKDVRLTVLASETALTLPAMKALFEILLHLVRNAVDHAVERSGAVEIRLFDDGRELYLSVADDGRGIDLEKLRARAVAAELIAENDFLSESETLSLLFAPGFSTAAAVTEISGRGVGLDAVKAGVENLNGKIFVRRRKTSGTIFEIFVPREGL